MNIIDKASDIIISTQTEYIEAQSSSDEEQFVFSYTITISNKGNEQVQLMTRRWLITDANGEVATVEGDGVVGQQPVILPGQSYTYTSGSVFKTPFGIMQGQYQMVDSKQQPFDVEIPVFRLATPNLLN